MKYFAIGVITVCCAFAAPSPALAEKPAAKVGDHVITVEELKKTINSTPYAMPDARISTEGASAPLVMDILGGMIDGELLYQDALAAGAASSARWRKETAEWRKRRLADRARESILASVIVDDAAVKKLAKEKGATGEAARATLANAGRHKAIDAELSRLFDAYHVKYSPDIASVPLDKFADDDILVSSSAFSIYYKDVKKTVAGHGNNKNALMEILGQILERELFAALAATQGLDKASSFKDEEAENNRLTAIDIHRDALEDKFKPSENELASFIKANGYLAERPRKAQVQLIVVKSEKEAAHIRERALNGENFQRLAVDNSIAPNAAVNSGGIPAITIGDHPRTSVEKALLDLKPGEITRPIKGDKGYSLFKLLSITPKEIRPGPERRELAARMIVDRKMGEHIAGLRKKTKVMIYPAIKEL